MHPNGISPDATQTFTLNVNTTTSAPAITSANNDTETFGVPFSYTITTDGYPAPALTKTGALPAGVSFTDNGDGTATLSGTPSNTAIGDYHLTLKAQNGISPNATQNFTLTITKAPVLHVIENKTTTGRHAILHDHHGQRQ